MRSHFVPYLNTMILVYVKFETTAITFTQIESFLRFRLWFHDCFHIELLLFKGPVSSTEMKSRGILDSIMYVIKQDK